MKDFIVAVLRTACKRRADNECDAKPAKIIRSELNCSGYEGESLTLQDVANMRQSIYRTRRKKYPALSKAQEESIEKLRSIPLSTNHKEVFLLYAKMTEIGPITIFTCITNLEHLTHAEFLLADGTFSVTPKHFLQLYTIHGYYGGHYVPLVYVLLPNKQERAYQQILDILKQQCLTMGLNLSSAVIMLDFEVSAMNAFRTVLPTASIRCCRFHMGQAMHRKICDLGLASPYKDDAETGKW